MVRVNLFAIWENLSQYSYKTRLPVRIFLCWKAVCRKVNWCITSDACQRISEKNMVWNNNVAKSVFFNEPSKRRSKGNDLFVSNNFPDIVLIHWRTVAKWKCSFLHYLSTIFSVLSAQMIKCYSHLYNHLQSTSKWLWNVFYKYHWHFLQAC